MKCLGEQTIRQPRRQHPFQIPADLEVSATPQSSHHENTAMIAMVTIGSTHVFTMWLVHEQTPFVQPRACRSTRSDHRNRKIVDPMQSRSRPFWMTSLISIRINNQTLESSLLSTLKTLFLSYVSPRTFDIIVLPVCFLTSPLANGGMEGMKVVIVGAGPVGSLAALYAAARGATVEIYELRSGELRMLLLLLPKLSPVLTRY